MKKCPYCYEDVQSEAVKCRHCLEWFICKEWGMHSVLNRASAVAILYAKKKHISRLYDIILKDFTIYNCSECKTGNYNLRGSQNDMGSILLKCENCNLEVLCKINDDAQESINIHEETGKTYASLLLEMVLDYSKGYDLLDSDKMGDLTDADFKTLVKANVN